MWLSQTSLPLLHPLRLWTCQECRHPEASHCCWQCHHGARAPDPALQHSCLRWLPAALQQLHCCPSGRAPRMRGSSRCEGRRHRHSQACRPPDLEQPPAPAPGWPSAWLAGSFADAPALYSAAEAVRPSMVAGLVSQPAGCVLHIASDISTMYQGCKACADVISR